MPDQPDHGPKDRPSHRHAASNLAAAPVFVLVQPQMGENIGAVARAMLNFGVSGLRLVRPRDGWPNEKAGAMAAGASAVIDNAQVFDSLSESARRLLFCNGDDGASAGARYACDRSRSSDVDLPRTYGRRTKLCRGVRRRAQWSQQRRRRHGRSSDFYPGQSCIRIPQPGAGCVHPFLCMVKNTRCGSRQSNP